MRPLRSNTSASSETVPSTPVTRKMAGAINRYERKRLNQCLNWDLVSGKQICSKRDAQLAQCLTNNVNAARDYHHGILGASRQLLGAGQCGFNVGFANYVGAAARDSFSDLFR